METAHLFVIRKRVRLKFETILRLPLFTFITKHDYDMIVLVNEPKRARTLDLIGARIQPQGFDERVAKADVHQPAFIERDHERHVIEDWPKTSGRMRHA